MKKSLLTIVLAATSVVVTAQATLLVKAPGNNNATTQVRAPNGTTASAFLRACALVLPSELTTIAPGTTITSFGFTLTTGGNVNVPGNITVYLENTPNTSYTKNSTFATAITGMTSVYSGAMTVPATNSPTLIVFNLTTPFVYSGGGMYVAFDWSTTGPYNTTQIATYESESLALNPGCATAASNVSAPPTLTSSTNFRPCFLFGIANSYTNDIHYVGTDAPGKISGMFNNPHNIKAEIKNGSNMTRNNITVNLNVTGSNPFSDTQIIPSLAAGAFTTVVFAPYNPQSAGLSTIAVSVPADENNANNTGSITQSVSCNHWALNPSVGSYSNSVGFNQGSGIIASNYFNPVNSTLVGMRFAISTNTPSIGNQGWGVLLNAGGGIIATTNTITITGPMLGTFQNFTFPVPQNLAANTTYYLGFAQPANANGYFPAAALTTPYIPPGAYWVTGLGGGVLTALTNNLGFFGIEAIFQSTVNVTVPSQTVQCGTTATLNANSTTNYSWSTGATSQSIAVTPTSNTTYTVIASNTLGCISSATANVNVIPLQVTASASPGVLCSGSSATLTASGATSYSWNTGSTAASLIVSPVSTSLYIVTGSDPSGCSNTASVAIPVQSFTNMNVSTTNISACKGTQFIISASGALTYTWDTGSNTYTGSTLSHTAAASGVYSVTGTNGTGCTHTRTVNVTINTAPIVLPADTAICKGSTVTIGALGAISFTWNNGSNFQSIQVSPLTSTGYTVDGHGVNGCLGTDSIRIDVLENPTVTAVPKRTQMCRNEKNTITASGADTYSWSTNASGPTVTIQIATLGNYTYEVTGYNDNGCKSSSVVTIQVFLCSGLAENSGGELEFDIYPNPAGDHISIVANGHLKSGSLVLHNSLGDKIVYLKIESANTRLSLEKLPAGVYFVSLLEGDKVTGVKKLIKN